MPGFFIDISPEITPFIKRENITVYKLLIRYEISEKYKGILYEQIQTLMENQPWWSICKNHFGLFYLK